jgi:AraC family transcriptional regulator
VSGQLGIEALLIQIFGVLGRSNNAAAGKKPKWVSRLKEMLHESSTDCRLADLARAVDVHPVHLSREFAKYFGASLGDYIRTIKVQRAMTLLPDTELSLTDIAFECEFADQSHFIRSFKSYYHITPLLYRKLFLKTGGG